MFNKNIGSRKADELVVTNYVDSKRWAPVKVWSEAAGGRFTPRARAEAWGGGAKRRMD